MTSIQILRVLEKKGEAQLGQARSRLTERSMTFESLQRQSQRIGISLESGKKQATGMQCPPQVKELGLQRLQHMHGALIRLLEGTKNACQELSRAQSDYRTAEQKLSLLRESLSLRTRLERSKAEDRAQEEDLGTSIAAQNVCSGTAPQQTSAGEIQEADRPAKQQAPQAAPDERMTNIDERGSIQCTFVTGAGEVVAVVASMPAASEVEIGLAAPAQTASLLEEGRGHIAKELQKRKFSVRAVTVLKQGDSDESL